MGYRYLTVFFILVVNIRNLNNDGKFLHSDAVNFYENMKLRFTKPLTLQRHSDEGGI
jgi:hypothetical protein